MPVLITPGAFTRSSSFARLADRLDGQVVDLPVRSRRLPQLDLGGLAASGAALDAAVDAAEDDGRPLVLVGHSLGGLLTLRAARRHPVAAQVLLMPAPPDGLLRDMGRLVRTDPVSACKLAALCVTTLPARSPHFSPPRGLYTAAADSDTLAESRAHRADESLLTLLQLLVGSRAPLEPATVPTFVVGGSLDTLVPPATARRVADRLGADYAELDVAHNFSEEPAGVVVEEAVERWLDARGLLGRPTPVS